MIKLLVTSLVFMAAQQYAPSHPLYLADTELGCLETVWQRTSPTEDDKKFDIKNDYDANGGRFSCMGEVSPTEISRLLKTLKNAVSSGSGEKIANYIDYPFVYSPKLNNSENPAQAYGSDEVKDKAEFISRFDEIFSNEFKSVVACVSYDQLEVSRGNHVYFARGYVHFNLLENSQHIKLTAISSFDKWSKRWHEQNCQ